MRWKELEIVVPLSIRVTVADGDDDITHAADAFRKAIAEINNADAEITENAQAAVYLTEDEITDRIGNAEMIDVYDEPDDDEDYIQQWAPPTHETNRDRAD